VRFLRVVSGIDHPACIDLVRANAGAILYLAGQAPDLPSGVEAARQLIFSGRAFEKLCRWVTVQSDDAGAGRECFAAIAAQAGLKNEVAALM
jgi:anthranilate phosphoribosyltransferase